VLPDSDLVLEVPASGGAPIAIDPTADGIGLYWPTGVAVDGTGDLFIVDNHNNRVVEIPFGGGAPIPINPNVDGETLNHPVSVAVDGEGNLFILDSGNYRLLKIPADGSTPIAINPTVNGIGLSFPEGVAVDRSGNLFIGDSSHSRVVEVPADGAAAIAIDPTVDNLSLNLILDLAVDGAGNLFISDTFNERVVEVPAGGGAPVAFNSSANGVPLYSPWGLAVDGSGNLFASSGEYVWELQRSQPPSFSFGNTSVGKTSSDSPQSTTILNIGNQPLAFTAVDYPADFPEGTGTNLCTSSTSLAPGQVCDVSVNFSPLTAGQLSENVTIKDNALNLPSSAQKISVNGNSQKTQTITFAALPNVVLGTAPFTLKATATSGLAVSFAVTGPATLSGSTLTLTGGGLVSVTATQAGNATYAAAPPVTRSFTVFLTPTVKIQSSTVSVTLGWPVTFTATISGTGATPTGAITFYSGSTSLGPATISAGVATLTTSALPLGSHTITAKYSGDTTYTTATSTAITQLVTNTPRLTLAASPNPALLYSPITLTATVENPTGSPLPTNQVKFFADFQPLGLATLTNGVATLQTSTLSVGQHYISVEYLGDAAYKYMPAVVQRVWVGRIPVTLAVTSPYNPVGLGNQLTFTATLAGTLTNKPATGIIHFYVGNVLLGTGTLSGNTATFSTSTLPMGASTITAQFWGDTNYLSTKSPNFTQYVW
jgi:hypothetical protein